MCHHVPCGEIHWRCQESGSRTQKIRRLCTGRAGSREHGGRGRGTQSHAHTLTLTTYTHLTVHPNIFSTQFFTSSGTFCSVIKAPGICIHIAHVRSYHRYAHVRTCPSLCTHLPPGHTLIHTTCSCTGRQPNKLAWEKLRRGSPR